MPRIAKIIKVEVMTDLLSQLPDHLFHQILLKLATKDSVKTSVLSTRWRYLWKSVPGLYLDYFDFSGCKGLKGFINRFLDLDKKSVIYRFEMEFFDEEYETEVYKWTNQVVNRGVQYLVVVCNYYGGRTCKMKLPGSISTCETLVHLELEHVGIQRFDSVSLPSLKTLYLSSVWFSSDAAVERLISSSPALQLLDIEEVLNVEYLRVRSHTLNSLSICINKTNSNVHGEINGVVIVAPSLKCLSLKIHRFKDLVLNCVCSPTKVDIQILVFDEIDFCSINAPAMKTLRTFLACTSKVTNLSLHSYTLKALCAYTKFESLPQFSNLTRLNVSSSDKEWSLRTILASCPNLKSLDLEHLATRYYYHPPLKILDIFRLNQPKCLLTSLESVVIRHSVQTKIIEYLLRNAAVLKELTLQFRCRNAEHKFQFLKQILTFPRRSSACHIFVRTFCKCCENHVLV